MTASKGIGITVMVEDDSWSERHGDALEPLARRAVTAALAAAEIAELPEAEMKLGVTVVFESDAQVALLNRDFRGKDKPTNVLSFPMLEIEDGRFMLGDLVLARGVIEREAQEQGKSFNDHLTHLIVHGTLHLAGYDHMEEGEAEEMESLEIRILADMGIENPYSDGDFMA
jgi:probable rRNA maturation factor